MAGSSSSAAVAVWPSTAEQKHRFDLAHASRLAVAGELTGSIAHEINQPLGAILSNADAADLILESGADRRDEAARRFSPTSAATTCAPAR